MKKVLYILSIGLLVMGMLCGCQKKEIITSDDGWKKGEPNVFGDGWIYSEGKLHISKIYYTVIEVLGNGQCLYQEPWINYKNQNLITDIEIDAEMIYTTVSNITGEEYPDVIGNDKAFAGGGPLFGNMNSLESIKIKKLDLDKITDISYMFANNKNLIDGDFSGLYMSNVKDATGLFRGDEQLIFLDLNTWITDNVETLDRMFEGCTNLTYVEIDSWDTGKVKSFQHVFSGCISLNDINLAGWTINDADVAGMFSNCINLKNVNLPNVTLKNTIAANPMFDENNSILSYRFADGWDIYVEDHKQIWPIAEDCYIKEVRFEPMSGVVVVCIYYQKFVPDWYKQSVEYLHNVHDFTNVYSTERMDIWMDVTDRKFNVVDVIHVMLDALYETGKISGDDNVFIGNAVDKAEILLNISAGDFSIGDIKDFMEMSIEELEIISEQYEGE